MAEYDFIQIQDKLFKELDRSRYAHTMGVMYTCASLAMVHDVDLQKAQIAGLLHDCAKCLPNRKKIKICQKHNIKISKIENESPYLLHGKAGAVLAKEKYNIDDREVMEAIAFHTTGKAGLTPLGKIVYIADYIEPMRNQAPRLEEIRKTAFRDLDECMYMILYDTIQYLDGSSKTMDPTTRRAFDFYEKIHVENHREER